MLILAVCLFTVCPPIDRQLQPLFTAVRRVETGCEPNGGRDAIGKAGELGPYQIRKSYWLDSRVPGQFEQVRDPRYARQVMLGYWKRYCPHALAKRDFKTLARIHNGGWNGHRKPSTLIYWSRVRAALRKEKP